MGRGSLAATRLLLETGAMLCGCSVDLVLVGAEAVVENGGVINKLGTYQVGP